MFYSSSHSLQILVWSSHSHSCWIGHFILLLLSLKNDYLKNLFLNNYVFLKGPINFISSILANIPVLIEYGTIWHPVIRVQGYKKKKKTRRWLRQENWTHFDGLISEHDGSHWTKQHFWNFFYQSPSSNTNAISDNKEHQKYTLLQKGNEIKINWVIKMKIKT